MKPSAPSDSGSITPVDGNQQHALIPVRLPQQTFEESKAVAIAIAHGPLHRHWTELDGEVALRHVRPGANLEIKLMGSPLLDLLGLPLTIESLKEQLDGLRLSAVLLLHVVIGTLLERAEPLLGSVTVAIDDLIAAIGWDPRSTAERDEMRRTVWRWLLVIESMLVIGQRRGTYRNPHTRKVLDLTSRDPLIRVTGQLVPQQQVLDPAATPLVVTLAPGAWLQQWRVRREVLAYFGEVRRLARISAGKPSGAWAQAIGLALQQVWRERAHEALVARVGEEKKRTVRVGTVTRRQLLDLFPPSYAVHEVLDGPNPKRAREYWDAAIDLLKGAKVIGYYRETSTLSESRQGWVDAWLDQPLDIRPKGDDLAAVVEIARSASAASKARRRRKHTQTNRSTASHGAA